MKIKIRKKRVIRKSQHQIHKKGTKNPLIQPFFTKNKTKSTTDPQDTKNQQNQHIKPLSKITN